MRVLWTLREAIFSSFISHSVHNVGIHLNRGPELYWSSLWVVVSFVACLYVDPTVLWIAYAVVLLIIQLEKCSLLSTWKPFYIHIKIHLQIICNLGSSIWYEGNYFNVRHAVLILCLHNKLAKILHAFIKLKF